MTNIFSLPKFIEHKIAGAETEAVTAKMYEYLLAGNGLFVRATRREFTATVSLCRQTIKGLPETAAGIVWHKPKIGAHVWQQILKHARPNTRRDDFTENLYVVFWRDEYSDWFWTQISRERRYAATIAEDSRAEYGEACVELHTHPPGALYFSGADDRDESGKFRIFGILADVHDAPKIRFRCGVYDYFEQIQAGTLDEMPAAVIDLNAAEQKILRLLNRRLETPKSS